MKASLRAVLCLNVPKEKSELRKNTVGSKRTFVKVTTCVKKGVQDQREAGREKIRGGKEGSGRGSVAGTTSNKSRLLEREEISLRRRAEAIIKGDGGKRKTSGGNLM